MKFLQILGALFLVSFDLHAAQSREWTLLIYSAADEGFLGRESNFSKTTLKVLKSIETLEELRNDSTAILLQFDASGDDRDGVEDNREYRRRFEYSKSPSPDRLDSRSIPESEIQKFDPDFRYGEPNSGRASTLKKFIQWGIRAFPARHYGLVLQGHSWGRLGSMLDLHVDGRDVEGYLIKNYEARRILEEVIREDRPLIPEGKLDVLVIDACISGQLDILNEFKEVFEYTVSTSTEIPYFSFPYPDILGPFLDSVAENVKRGRLTNSKWTEKTLLIPMVRQLIESHGPKGSLARLEKQTDILEAFAIRNQALSQVEEKLRTFVGSMPEEIKRSFHRDQPWSVWELPDSDENVDLFEFSNEFLKTYEAAEKNHNRGVLQRAIYSTRELQKALHYRYQSPTFEKQKIGHAVAQGAWARVFLETISEDWEVVACHAIKAFAYLNFDQTWLVPKVWNKDSKEVRVQRITCNDQADELEKAGRVHTRLPPGSHQIHKILELEPVFPQWPAYLSETRDQEGKLKERILSIWLPVQKMDYSVRLRLPGTQRYTLEYKGTPQGPTLDSVGLSYPSYVVRTDFDGLYVAEGHTLGTPFKQGLGIFLAHEFAEGLEYRTGRLPVEEVERILSRPRFSISQEHYERNFEWYQRELERRGVELEQEGLEFYRLHRIRRTLWPTLWPERKNFTQLF